MMHQGHTFVKGFRNGPMRMVATGRQGSLSRRFVRETVSFISTLVEADRGSGRRAHSFAWEALATHSNAIDPRAMRLSRNPTERYHGISPQYAESARES